MFSGDFFIAFFSLYYEQNENCVALEMATLNKNNSLVY